MKREFLATGQLRSFTRQLLKCHCRGCQTYYSAMTYVATQKNFKKRTNKVDKDSLEAFNWKEPIIGMLYLKGNINREVFEIAKQEIGTYYNNGVDVVLVENYFGTYYRMIPVLEYLQENYKDHTYGANCSYQNTLTFELAIKYEAHLVRVDAIAGNLIEREDISFVEFIKLYHSRHPEYIIGGVRFKHTSYLSGKNLEEDLKTVTTHCDVVTVSQDETGQETSMKGIQEFRDIIGDSPLTVGVGLTTENCTKQFAVIDGGIVGSQVKDTHIATGIIDEKNVQKLTAVRDTLIKGE